MKKKTLIIALLLVVATMGIGFSILSTHLKIQGSVKVDKSFNVEIVGIKRVNYRDYFAVGGSANSVYSKGEAKELAEPTYTATTATFNVSMGLDSKLLYLVTLENKGTMAAQIKDVGIARTAQGGTPDVQIDLPIDIHDRVLGIGEKATFLVRLTYPYSEDLSGLDTIVSVDFDVKQAVGDINYANSVPMYLAIPGFQYSGSMAFPIEIVGLDSNANIGSTGADRYKLYETVDDGEAVALSSSDRFTRVSKFEQFGGINYIPSSDLNDGVNHIIKLQLCEEFSNICTNELSFNYQSGQGAPANG